MENSKISWTHHTFNPWIGCTKVSAGCANCYAETLMAVRYKKVKWGKGNPRLRTAEANWKKPLLWNKQAAENVEDALHCFGEDKYIAPERPRVFCASLADWLDDEVPIEWLSDLLALIHATPNLDWLLLTKRPQNFTQRMMLVMQYCDDVLAEWIKLWTWSENNGGGHPPANVWLGTSVEDQKNADERIPLLLEIPANIHFLSMEPLLGPVNLHQQHPDPCDKNCWLSRLKWVIVGGESGRGARPMQAEWVRDLRDQCVSAGVAFHFKQWGGVNKEATGRMLDGRTWGEVPIHP